MRIILAFVTAVAAIMAVGALAEGDLRGFGPTGAVAAVAGFFLWRNLRDPEITRKAGLRARVTFAFAPADGVSRDGTYARIDTYAGAWNVTLKRTPQRGDMQMYDTPQRGWVWLDEAGLPARIKINFATTWKTWPVVSAAPVPQPQGLHE